MDNRKKISIFLLIFFLIFPFYVHAAKGVVSNDVQTCLGCHSEKNLNMQLENKETFSLYVNGSEFAGSVHASLGCAGCHTDISMEKHPQAKKVKSSREYSAAASKTCSMCHTDDQLKKKAMHGYFTAKVKAVPCSECHGAHSIKKMPEWKKSVSDPKYCLTCHKYDFSMRLGNGEVLPLSVNEASLRASVHKNLICTVCHMNFSKNRHPSRMFKSRRDFSAESSGACKMCHPDSQLRKNPVHSSLLATAGCAECHGSHNIQSMAVQKKGTKEAQYCLSCHKRRLNLRMKNGESLSVYVDEAALRSSVHKNIQCNECHTGFSKTAHPVRTFGSIGEYSLTSAGLCRKCHADAFDKYEMSIHYSMLKEGNVKAPSCSGCHGTHDIAKATEDKTLGLKLCSKCHGDMTASYEASIHNQARLQGKPNTPTCASCHNAHDVESTRMTTKIKEGCIRCHKDAAKKHDKWLANPPITLSTFAAAHFDVVSCASCHSPGTERAIYLSLFNRKTGKPVPEEELAKLLDTDAAGLMARIDGNGDGSIDGREMWNLFADLYKKDVTTIFLGKMDVHSPAEAHEITSKKEAVKACDKCHHPRADFFKNVYIVVSRAKGQPAVMNAKRDVLNSVFAILPVSKFYALGSTNVKLFDILFIIALIGGIAVPIGHILLRVITSPLRSLRRMRKGGK